MRTSLEVWRDARLNLTQILPPESDGQRHSLDSATMTEWFQARPGRFRLLGLERTAGSRKMRTAKTSVLLSTQAASLMKLSVDTTAYGLHGSDPSILAAIKGLEAVDLHLTGLGLDDRGAAVIRIASRLIALEQLDVVFEEDLTADVSPGDIKFPRCLELAELRSARLTDLSVAIASGTQDVLRLSGVPNLERCHLLAYQRSTAHFLVDPTTFAGCSQLKELSLHNLHNLSLQMGCFSALPALSYLTLTDCNLLAVPLAIAPLTTPCLLNLTFNDHFSIDQAGQNLLQTMKKLRVLDVAKREPATHTACSMQALIHVVKAFATDKLWLDVNVDPKLCQTYEADIGYWGST